MISRLDIPLVDYFAFYPLARNNIPVEQFRLCGSFMPKGLKCNIDSDGGMEYWANVVQDFMDRTFILNSFARLNAGFYKIINWNSHKTQIVFKFDFHQNTIKLHICHREYDAGVVQ